jgi:uncharacterized membrane protein YfcA
LGCSNGFVASLDIFIDRGHAPYQPWEYQPEPLGPLTAAGLLGTWIGTTIGLHVPGPRLRLYFIHVIMVAIVLIAVKLVHMTLYSIIHWH